MFSSPSQAFTIEHERGDDGARRRGGVRGDLRARGPGAAARFEELAAGDADWKRHERNAREVGRAINERDFEALAALLDPELTQIDHRSGCRRRRGRDRTQFVEGFRVGAEVVPELHAEPTVLDVRGDRRLARTTFRGLAPSGGGVSEMVLDAVIVLVGTG